MNPSVRETQALLTSVRNKNKGAGETDRFIDIPPLLAKEQGDRPKRG